MKIIVWLAAILPAAAFAGNLVGSTAPPYPDGLTGRGGACIARALPGAASSCDFSIGVLEDSSGVPQILYGARLAGRNESRRAFWTITDVMPYPVLPKDYILAIGRCQDNGKANDSIMAAVRVTDTEWLTDVLWARRYDFDTHKFIEHPAGGVRCINEGWGL